jgi:N-methylhydantoinase A
MLARMLPFLARLGVGPADLSLMIFGGAGGIHGPILAEEIGVRRIVVPRLPSVFCAFGALVSDLVHDGVRSVQDVDLPEEVFVALYDDLVREGQAWLDRQGQVLRVDRLPLADMRYAAQSFTIPVDISSALARPSGLLEEVRTLFYEEHRRSFGHANANAPIAIDDLRLRTIDRQAKPSAVEVVTGLSTTPRPIEHRALCLGGRWHEGVPVYPCSDLSKGWSQPGPAVIQQDLATTLVPEGYNAHISAFGDLEMVKEA